MNGRFCAACGTLNHLAARFCDHCGVRMAAAAGVACPRCGAPACPADRFCDECGERLPASAMLILDEEGWRVALPDRAALIVGRRDVYSGVQPDVDLEPYGAASHGISRRHARITRDRGRCHIEDLQSANLTYVNDQRLNPGAPRELQDGDRLVFGNLSVVFRDL
jgi:hypothetical protein